MQIVYKGLEQSVLGTKAEAGVLVLISKDTKGWLQFCVLIMNHIQGHSMDSDGSRQNPGHWWNDHVC